jgi:hypothetical protein
MPIRPMEVRARAGNTSTENGDGSAKENYGID